MNADKWWKEDETLFIMIWLLEDILKQIPQELYEWNKFIQPQALVNVIEKAGFVDVLLKGFDLTKALILKVLKISY